jgi:hypothetical protein
MRPWCLAPEAGFGESNLRRLIAEHMFATPRQTRTPKMWRVFGQGPAV